MEQKILSIIAYVLMSWCVITCVLNGGDDD